MAKMHIIRVEPLRTAIKTLVRGFGSEPREVDLVTENLIQANLTGHDSHGIGMLPKYSEAFVEGGLKANAHVIQKAANKGLDILRDYCLEHEFSFIHDGTFGNYKICTYSV